VTKKNNEAGKLNRDVFETFLNLDITPLVTRKMNLDYLSWSRAWTIVQQYYPGTQRHYTDFPSPVDSSVSLGALIYPGGSAEVECRVDLLHPSGEVISHTERLPVMDNKNKAIVQPSTRDIADARQRCLVKCLAMGFGLGLSLWSGDIVSMIVNESQSGESDSQDKSNSLLNRFRSSLDGKIKMTAKEVDKLYLDMKKEPITKATEKQLVAYRNWLIEQKK